MEAINPSGIWSKQRQRGNLGSSAHNRAPKAGGGKGRKETLTDRKLAVSKKKMSSDKTGGKERGRGGGAFRSLCVHCTFSEAIAATRERMKGTSSPSYDNDGRAATAMSHSAKAGAALHVNPGLDRKLQCTSKTRTISSLSASSRDFQVLPPP